MTEVMPNIIASTFFIFNLSVLKRADNIINLLHLFLFFSFLSYSLIYKV